MRMASHSQFFASCDLTRYDCQVLLASVWTASSRRYLPGEKKARAAHSEEKNTELRLLNGGSESQRAFLTTLDGVVRSRRWLEERVRRPSVRSAVKWLAISSPVSGPAGLYQVPIQLMAPDMAKDASLESQGAMDLSAIPSSM